MQNEIPLLYIKVAVRYGQNIFSTERFLHCFMHDIMYAINSLFLTQRGEGGGGVGQNGRENTQQRKLYHQSF